MKSSSKKNVIGLIGVAIAMTTYSALGQTPWTTDDIHWNTTSGAWNTAGNWTPAGPPNSTHDVYFNGTGSWTVTFPGGTAPPPRIFFPIAHLNVYTGGPYVEFSKSSGDADNVVAVSGNANVTSDQPSGTHEFRLTTVDLEIDGTLSVSGYAQMLVRTDADVVTEKLAMGASSKLTVDGTGSTLTVLSNEAATNVIGNGGSGLSQMVIQQGSTGNTIAGSLEIGKTSDGTLQVGGSGSATALTLGNIVDDPAGRGSHLFIGGQAISGVDGKLIIRSSSSVTQLDGTSEPSTITVGAATGSTGQINIGDSGSGTLTTGTGLMTINKTGTVNVGNGVSSGTLNANGDITIDGGVLKRDPSSSVFNFASGRTLNVINGGRITFDGGAYTTSGSLYNIRGNGSKLELTGSGALNVNNGAQLNVSQGGTVSTAVGAGANPINVGTSGSGMLSVDGVGSLAVAGATSTASSFGSGGNVATATFSNRATGSFAAGLNLADNSTNGTTAIVAVESGARLTTGALNLATLGGTSGAFLTVTGANSLVNPTSLTIGASSSSTAIVNAMDSGSLTVGGGGATTLNATGTININGGAVDLQNLTAAAGGKINFTAGSLNYIGNLTVGSGGLLGTNLTLNGDRRLTVSGSGSTGKITVNSGSSLLLESADGLTTTALENNGEVVFDGLVAAANTTTFTNKNGGLVRGEGRIIASAGSNAITNEFGAEIRAESGKRIKLQGTNAANAGRINLQGGTAEFTSALVNGSAGQILGRGTLITAGLTNNGHIAFSSGITDVFGDVENDTGSSSKGITVSGNSDVTFWDDFVNNSGLMRVSAGSSVTFFSPYSGAGLTGPGAAYYESDISPGFSPASVQYGGDVYLSSTATLHMELGGTTAGTQHDKVNVAGLLSLDGILDVSLINGFAPVAGNTFDILDWATLAGTFADLQLPVLSSSLMWDTSNLYNNGTLSVGLLGDFDDNGVVNAADIDILWHIVRGSGSDPNNNDSADLDGNDLVNEDDVDTMLASLLTAGPNRRYGDANLSGGFPDLTDYNAWRTGTGGWAGGDFDGSGGAPDLNDYNLWLTGPTQFPGTVGPHAGGEGAPLVPEPATCVLLGIGGIAGMAWRLSSGMRDRKRQTAVP